MTHPLNCKSASNKKESSFIKRVFEAEGVQVSTPRETLSHAYQANWIQNEKLWLKMLEDRNITSHVYSEQEANLIFDRIHDFYLKELKQAFQFIKHRFQSR